MIRLVYDRVQSPELKLLFSRASIPYPPDNCLVEEKYIPGTVEEKYIPGTKPPPFYSFHELVDD